MLCAGVNGTLYSDDADTYSAYVPPGILEHHDVPHVKGQYVRPVNVPMYVPGYEGSGRKTMRSSKCGCQKVEGARHHIVARIPPGLHAPDTVEGKIILDRHIRASQWSYMISTKDAWVEFARASQAYHETHHD